MFLFCFLHIVFSNRIQLLPCLFSDAEEEEQGEEQVEKKERKYKHNPEVLNQRKGMYSSYYELLKYSLLNVSLLYSEEEDVPEEKVEVDWEEETQKRNPRRGRRGTQEEEEEEPKKRSQQKRYEKWIQKKRNHQKRKQEEQEEEWEEDYQTNGKSAIAFVKRWIWLIHLLFTDGEKDRLRIGTWRGNFKSSKKISMKQKVHPQMLLYTRWQELFIDLISLMTFTYSSFCFQIERRHRRELWCWWRSRGKHTSGTNNIDEE